MIIDKRIEKNNPVTVDAMQKGIEVEADAVDFVATCFFRAGGDVVENKGGKQLTFVLRDFRHYRTLYFEMRLRLDMLRSFLGVELEEVFWSITVFPSQLIDLLRELSGSIPGNGDSRINEEFRAIRVDVNLVGVK